MVIQLSFMVTLCNSIVYQIRRNRMTAKQMTAKQMTTELLLNDPQQMTTE